MNRIILIGNGFDLAHGMKTNYKDFISSYWEKCINEISSIPTEQEYENSEIKIETRGYYPIKVNSYEELSEKLSSRGIYIHFKNLFFEIINEMSTVRNWVDIENEYYILLKNAVKSGDDVSKLNEDFQNIKNILVEYLKEVEEKFNLNIRAELSTCKEIIGNKIYQNFKYRDLSEVALNQEAELEYNLLKNDLDDYVNEKKFLEEINQNNRKIIERIDNLKPLHEIKKLLLSDYAYKYFDIVPEQILFLNFNYTLTEKNYINPSEFDLISNNLPLVKSIHIHGTSEEDNNPIIFGFGDELDEDYKKIEKLNNNKFLENIKSINYLETDNYKKLLEYINSGNFQVFIFGHSCGISDRTLLNTIFEHDNCASIKLYYHQISDNEDNYSDIVRNISRNFNDKAKMRDRVVNKRYCEPLR